MFQIPQRTAAPHLRQDLEVVFRRRRGRGPLERPCVPGIIASRLSMPQRPQEIDHQAANAGGLKESPNRRDHIVDFPTAARVIGINAPRHPEDPGYVLRVEGEMKADEEEPEMPQAEFLVQHPAHCFWIPVINGGKESERKTTDQHVMKVRHHEVRVGQLPVERRHRQHNARQSSDQELEEEGDAKKHGQLKTNLTAVHGGQPIEDLNPGRYPHEHRRNSEEAVGHFTHTHREHVVRPHTHADETDRYCRRDHNGVTEDRFARKYGDDLRRAGPARDHQDVHFGMTKDPEEMWPRTPRAPAWVSKKREPRNRSSSSMICAADNGGSARIIIPDVTSTNQTNSGMRMSVMPLHRKLTTVAMTLIAETMLPTLLTNKPRIQ